MSLFVADSGWEDVIILNKNDLACEARDRYFKARRVLKQEVVLHRIKLLTQIVKILNTFVPTQRKRGIREEKGIYMTLSEFENDILTIAVPKS